MSSSSLREEKRAKERERKEWKRRLEEVEKIQNNLSGVMQDRITDVNTQIDKLTSQLEPAIKQIINISTQCDTAISMKENEWETNLTNTKSSLAREVRDVNSKINSLDSDIRDLERRIEDAEREEREERERQAREAMEKVKSFFS